MTANRIEIPYNEAGKRVYEVFYKIAYKQLQRAREATTAYMQIDEIVDEKAMNNGKYTAIFALPGGGQQSVTYDYRTKLIEIN